MEISLDKLLGGRVELFQPKQGFKATTDSVILAASIPFKQGERAIDLGSGLGVASLCLVARVSDAKVIGLEKNNDLVSLSNKSAKYMNVADRINFISCNIFNIEKPLYDSLNNMDHVILNPPWYSDRPFNRMENKEKRNAKVELNADLYDWLKVCRSLLSRRGRVTLIHRAESLSKVIFSLVKNQFGDITILPVMSKSGASAKTIVVSALSGSKGKCNIMSNIYLHDRRGNYTRTAEDILRNAKPTALGL